MGKKPSSLRVLSETIGWLEIISIITGVPAMIAFISTIWHSLSTISQVIAIIAFLVILFAIACFIYGQTRKILYRIPKILYQMHLRTVELASPLNMETLNPEDLANLMSLVNIDTSQLISQLEDANIESLADIEPLQVLASKWAEIAESKSKEIRAEEETSQGETSQRVLQFMYKVIGLNQELETDETYQQLRQKLNKMLLLIPTTEIHQAILEYNKMSRVVVVFLPVVKAMDGQVQNIIPLPYRIDGTRKKEDLNDQLMMQLTKVRECIGKYYRGE